MGINLKSDLKALDDRYFEVSGSFAPNTATNPATATRYGAGFTVVHTSTGLFTITFTEAFVEVISATCSLQLATAADQFANIGVISVTNKTAQILIWDISDNAVADVALDDNNRVNFNFVFRWR